MNKTILTDVDGVLLDWTGKFEEWVQNERFPAEVIEESLHDYSSIEKWLNISYKDAGKLIEEFNNSECFKDLPPFEDAVEVVNKLKKEGYNFIAITACDDSEQSISCRTENLNKYFPNVFDELIHTGLRAKKGKKPHLEKWQNCFWIEDTYKHALVGQDVGHTVFLIDGNRNKDLTEVRDGIIKVNSWFEIYEDVTGLEYVD